MSEPEEKDGQQKEGDVKEEVPVSWEALLVVVPFNLMCALNDCVTAEECPWCVCLLLQCV